MINEISVKLVNIRVKMEDENFIIIHGSK